MNNDNIWEKLNLTHDDVIIASTIKSGTTWLQQIVAQLIHKGKFTDKLSLTELSTLTIIKPMKIKKES